MIEQTIAQQAVELIETEFPLLEGVEHLAEKMAVSKCHLIRCFTAEIGVSPGKYLTSVRIKASKTYLKHQDYSIEMIAGLVGFACGNYFSKVFRKTTGFSPIEYKKNNLIVDTADKKLNRISDDISFV